MVTMVSTMHNGTEFIVRNRKKPRINKTNKSHVEELFGEESVAQVSIPKFIDDYNHWMLGVDKSDQFISYYRPKLRVRRYWMAMMFHCLDIICINLFIVVKNLSDKTIKHKKFIHKFV